MIAAIYWSIQLYDSLLENLTIGSFEIGKITNNFNVKISFEQLKDLNELKIAD